MRVAVVAVVAALALTGARIASADLSPGQALALWTSLNARLSSGAQPTASDLALLKRLLTYAEAHWRTDPVQASILRGFESRANNSDVQANVRAAVPSAEAYFANHGGYIGMNDATLRRQYDGGFRAHVAWAERAHYCLENVKVVHGGPLDGRTFAAHYLGPGGKTVQTGRC